MCFSRRKCQNPLHQFPRSKSVTSWRGQKSVVSVVSCRFPNSITTACCQLVADLLAESLTSPQQVGSFSVYGEVTGKRVLLCNGTLILTQSATVDDEPSWLGRVWRRPIVAVKTERLKRRLYRLAMALTQQVSEPVNPTRHCTQSATRWVLQPFIAYTLTHWNTPQRVLVSDI